MRKKPYYLTDYERDNLVISTIEKLGINVDDLYTNINQKIKLLKKIKYHSIRVGPEKSKHPFRRISECEDFRISAVMRNIYNLAKRRIQEYEEGNREIVNNKEGGLDSLLVEVKRNEKKVKQLDRGLF